MDNLGIANVLAEVTSSDRRLEREARQIELQRQISANTRGQEIDESQAELELQQLQSERIEQGFATAGFLVQRLLDEPEFHDVADEDLPAAQERFNARLDQIGQLSGGFRPNIRLLSKAQQDKVRREFYERRLEANLGLRQLIDKPDNGLTVDSFFNSQAPMYEMLAPDGKGQPVYWSKNWILGTQGVDPATMRPEGSVILDPNSPTGKKKSPTRKSGSGVTGNKQHEIDTGNSRKATVDLFANKRYDELVERAQNGDTVPTSAAADVVTAASLKGKDSESFRGVLATALQDPEFQPYAPHLIQGKSFPTEIKDSEQITNKDLIGTTISYARGLYDHIATSGDTPGQVKSILAGLKDFFGIETTAEEFNTITNDTLFKNLRATFLNQGGGKNLTANEIKVFGDAIGQNRDEYGRIMGVSILIDKQLSYLDQESVTLNLGEDYHEVRNSLLAAKATLIRSMSVLNEIHTDEENKANMLYYIGVQAGEYLKDSFTDYTFNGQTERHKENWSNNSFQALAIVEASAGAAGSRDLYNKKNSGRLYDNSPCIRLL